MDLVDEQHVARLEVREQRGEVAGPLEHRARGLAQVHADLVRDDVRERGLAEARRAEEQHVVERLAALAAPPAMKISSCALTLRLADVLGEPARAHGAVERLVLLDGRTV